MLRLPIFLTLSGLSGLTSWATGWGLHMGYWLVTEVKFVTNQTNYITGLLAVHLNGGHLGCLPKRPRFDLIR